MDTLSHARSDQTPHKHAISHIYALYIGLIFCRY